MLSFSVVTCTWNSLPFLVQCIESVSSQRGVSLEHIFVDGGSTDGTLEAIAAVRGNVKLLKEVRGGISNAMNVGLQAASNDVVVHLHGDDYFMGEDVLFRVSDNMEANEAEWLCGRIVQDVDGNLHYPRWKLPRVSRSALLKGNYISHPATFVRRSLYEKVGFFDNRLRYAMDYDMWLRMSMLASPVCVEEYYSCFRRHAGSLSTANALAAFREDHLVRMRYVKAAGELEWLHQLRYIWRGWRRYGIYPGKSGEFE